MKAENKTKTTAATSVGKKVSERLRRYFRLLIVTCVGTGAFHTVYLERRTPLEPDNGCVSNYRFKGAVKGCRNQELTVMRHMRNSLKDILFEVSLFQSENIRRKTKMFKNLL